MTRTLHQLIQHLKHTAILYRTDPTRMLAATYHHHLGDKTRAQTLIDETEAKRTST